jgi:hypothetical protein
VRWTSWIPAALACWILTGCGGSQKPGSRPTASITKVEPVKIIQFYTSTPQVPRGEKGLVCYGVVNAKAVWISPPKRELYPAQSRCIEVEPEGKVVYTLTAEAAGGELVSKDIVLEREGGAAKSNGAKVRIANVNISAAEAKPGEAVSICYKVENAQSVSIDPLSFRGGKERDGCVIDQPRKTTTYIIRATGAGGDSDEERVTIRVRAGG